MLIGIVIIAIIVLLLLITWAKMNPFVALIITSVGVGLASGMPMLKVIDSIKSGLGNTLGFLAVVLALGTMLGKMMAESGGAERIAKTLINRFGQRNVHWAMMFVAFIVGIPVFFQVGVVLLIPLLFTIAIETGISLVTLGVPLVAGLSVVHGLVPPHPAAITAVGIFKADVGLTILYSLIIGLPTAIVAGPLYGKWIGSRIHKSVPKEIGEHLVAHREEKDLPGFWNTLFTIMLPVILMLISSFATILIHNDKDPVRVALNFIGDPIISLLIATVYSFFSLGFFRGLNRDTILKFTNEALAPIATILLVIGGGGAFNKVLLDSGIGTQIADWAKGSGISPIILGWLIAALIRVATGSATVSMMTAAGIVAPIAAAMPVNKELLALATGAGSLILSHVNDSGFWMIKEYFGMSVKETLQTWTVLETIIAVVALAMILILDLIV
jgi:GntP family gluconate:H+ symporter